MNKYQEAFDYYWKVYNEHHLGMLARHYIDILKELVNQQSILEEYNVTPEILREVLLTGQMFRNQPTLDECIKEWEDNGCFVTESNKELIIESCEDFRDLDITICKVNLIYEISNYYRNKPACISPDLHHLLSKTLKALEEMKDE